MGMHVGKKGKLQSEINVTPLVDVVLVLLIIFMVVVPLTLRGYDVEVPERTLVPAGEEIPAPPIVLGMEAGHCPRPELLQPGLLPDACRIQLDGRSISAASLSAQLQTMFAESEAARPVLILDIEDQVNYELAVRVLDRARSAVPGLKIVVDYGSPTQQL